MSRDRHDRVFEIFTAACELAPEQQRPFLDRECAGDPALRAEVEDLLARDRAAGHPLDSPAIGAQAPDPTSMRAPLDPLPAAIGPYRPLAVLGEGGFGIVYLAEQTEPVRRRVALKVIKPGMDSKQVLARFEAERQALALMSHPNIARVYEAGITGQGRPYFVMEFVAGIPITAYCDESRLSVRERLDLFARVCGAIQHAHQKGIIHRDIKPTNVLVEIIDAKPVPKVIDFGVAKATAQRLTERTLFTEQGALIGTPEYMSPEQAELTQLDIDTRTDIYSLGVLLYEMLTGTLPFDPRALRRAAFAEIQRVIREVEPPRPSTRISTLGEAAPPGSAPPDGVPAHGAPAAPPTPSILAIAQRRATDPTALRRALRGDLDWITMKAMDKERTRRYSTAAELAADVARHLHHEPVVAGPPLLSYRLKKFVRRHRAPVVGAALVALALAAGAVGTAWQAVLATRAAESEAAQRRIAEQQKDRALDAEERATAALAQAHVRAAHMARQRGQWKQVIAAADSALEIGVAEPVPLLLLRLEAVSQLTPASLEDQLVTLERRPDAAAFAGPIALWRAQPRLASGADPGLVRAAAARAIQLGLSPADRAYAQALGASTFAEMIEHLRSCLDADPFHTRASEMMIVALNAVGDVAGAEKYLSAWLVLEPGNVTATSMLAGIYALSGRSDEAAALVKTLEDRLGQSAVRERMRTVAAFRDGLDFESFGTLEPWRAGELVQTLALLVGGASQAYTTDLTPDQAAELYSGQGMTPLTQELMGHIARGAAATMIRQFEAAAAAYADAYRIAPGPLVASMYAATTTMTGRYRRGAEVMKDAVARLDERSHLRRVCLFQGAIAAGNWAVSTKEPDEHALAKETAIWFVRRLLGGAPINPVYVWSVGIVGGQIQEPWIVTAAIADWKRWEPARPVDYKRAAAFHQAAKNPGGALFLVGHGLRRSPENLDLLAVRDACLETLLKRKNADVDVLLEAAGFKAGASPEATTVSDSSPD